MATNEREIKGKEIFENGSVKRINEFTYSVKSQSGNGDYAVWKVKDDWICNCADHFYRHITCKHLEAVKISLAMRTEVAIRRIEPIEFLNVCQICGSENIVRDGLRHNKYGNIQIFLCHDCGKHFTVNLGFERMKSTPQIVTSAMQLYFTGASLRKCAEFMQLQGVKVSYVAVYKWIKKYVKLMGTYADQLKPNVSDTWRADELWLKVKGDMKYLFAVMDDETRFWIAQEVAGSKYKHDARKIFQMAKEATGKKPMTLITDGLPAYHDAFNKEFFTLKNPRSKHINTIKLAGDMNNNKMERLNGEIRDREKVLRGLKKIDTPVLKGYQIYHNYIRPHEALEGKTPADACGIEVKGDNKWVTLIQNASRHH